MEKDCFDLYRTVNKEAPEDNESLNELIQFTTEVIQDENENYNYCKKLLNQLENELYKEVIYLRYFKNLTNEEVAEKIFHSVRHTSRLHKWAISELERIEEAQQALEQSVQSLGG